MDGVLTDDVCRQVGKEGSIKAVMDAMKAHKESDGVQECGCWALVSLSEDSMYPERLVVCQLVSA